jgi:hypothetical protein
LSKAFNVASYRHELCGHTICEVLHPLQTKFAGVVRSIIFDHIFKVAQPVDFAHGIIVQLKLQFVGKANGPSRVENSTNGRRRS